MSDPSDKVAELEQRIADLEAKNANLTESARRAANLSVAYSNARDDRNRFETDLARSEADREDLQKQVQQLTDERNTASAIAEEWYNWARKEHPERFDENGKWLKKPRKTKSRPEPDKAQANDIVPTLKDDNDVAPEPTSTQVLIAAKPRKRLSFRNNKKVT